MRVSDFQFELPEELIAQKPPSRRGSSRMLCMDIKTGLYEDDHFVNLPDRLCEGDLLILNDSRVIPARLYATRTSVQGQSYSAHPPGRIEVLLTKQLEPNLWTALVRPGKKVQLGETLLFAANDGPTLLQAKVVSVQEYGQRTLQFEPHPDFLSILDNIGHMPLPPYIHRGDSLEDRDRYQTVFAHEPGSAAAPTAGLHFTPEIFQRLKARGVQIETVTLHVGLGTFQPVRAENLDEIHLHTERYTVSVSTAQAINDALSQKRRIIAVGTTTTRTLEHCATLFPNEIKPHTGETNIFLSPGHKFCIVHGLLTNFHLPQSTLLMLVSAFGGREAVLAAYVHAVQKQYQFFSYGDCMLLL